MPKSKPNPLPGSLLALLAAAAGILVANIYYNQPMLGLLAREFGVGGGDIAVVPVLTQVGYALGLLFLSPLGDRLERKRLILATTAALTVALVLTAVAPTLAVLAGASLLIGVLATVTQQVVPLAAQLAPEARRGRSVGTVMMGLLLGILLARTLSGFVAGLAGWRASFAVATALTAAMGLLLAWRLPRVAPTITMSYPQLMRSLVDLFLAHRVLRRAALIQALLFGAFSAFWSVLALKLEAPPLGLGSSVAGMFGIIGAVGALVAPLAGRLTDKRGPAALVIFGATLAGGAFLPMGLWGNSLVALVAGVVVMDLGLQVCMIANQTRVYALDAAARSRLNTVYMTVMFSGGALGSALGARAWAGWGWDGVCALGAAMGLAAALIEMLALKGRRP
ncbi:MAG TPA: MFS transporter [Magnetospirillum sp.]|jgi:predicted MFS family arabinose efflux permease|nr:MFS transporter [Magnetospirillum sp.]